MVILVGSTVNAVLTFSDFDEPVQEGRLICAS